MGSKLLFQVVVIVVAVSLTFAPVFAQDVETADAGDANRSVTAAEDDNGPDLGWLGLVGLVGLAGLMRKDRRDYKHDDRAGNR